MMKAFQQRRWALVILWVLIIAAIVAAPSVLPVFRLNLLGRFLALAIVALGIDLIWGFTGLLSLGQGIFFALGGYAAAMYLQLNSSEDLLNGIPEFFTLYGVDRLPAFWQPNPSTNAKISPAACARGTLRTNCCSIKLTPQVANNVSNGLP